MNEKLSLKKLSLEELSIIQRVYHIAHAKSKKDRHFHDMFLKSEQPRITKIEDLHEYDDLLAYFGKLNITTKEKGVEK